MGDELPQYNPFNTVVCADCRWYAHLGRPDSEIDVCCHPDRARIEIRHPITGNPAFVDRNSYEDILFCWPSPSCELHNSRGDCRKFEAKSPEHDADGPHWAQRFFDEWLHGVRQELENKDRIIQELAKEKAEKEQERQ